MEKRLRRVVVGGKTRRLQSGRVGASCLQREPRRGGWVCRYRWAPGKLPPQSRLVARRRASRPLETANRAASSRPATLFHARTSSSGVV
ncbi:uncharacterized protein PADG_12521 [Paracoccidioides brasiliensis Pb18]|uniref:Uncharacterized protein n=1 Tax=Paracoccidioides brasiliensis (strain Pb18) TaxID=502780 RepID=A0A0A0HGP8_PARBD|nr:uncharacterized protein PADG_12521 [Paracoccidioides brasiliensis Pb18]KGM85839.1 hypothetical protein PADG_12521 [Paracoccidioides brasiliensis Pb18]